MEEEKHLNKKKIFIVTGIAGIVIIIFIIFLLLKNNLNGSSLLSNSNITVFSKDNKVSINFSNKLNLYESENKDDSLLINLYSKNDLYITSSKFSKILDRDIEELLNADKYSYINNYPNNFNVSEIYPISLKDYSCFAYNFYYKEEINDSFVDYFVTTIWIEKNSEVFILDIKLPANLLENNLEDLNNLIYSYTIY